MSDETALAPAPEAAAAPQEPPKQFANPREAVAELERRETERRAQRRADKAAREERIAAERERAAEAELEIERAAQRENVGDEAEADEGKPRKPKAEAKAKPQADEADEADDESEDTDDPEGDVSPEEDDADDDSDADDDEDDEPKSIKMPAKLKVGDTEVEIPKGTPKAAVEAIKSLQQRLTADYTRKTQEAAEVRKVSTERVQAADNLLQQVQRAQQAVVAMAERMIGSPPPLELARADPAAYLEAKEGYEARVRELQSLTSHTGELTRSQQQQRQQAQQQALLEEAQRTVKVLPQLADPAKRSAFLDSAVRAASQSGFSPDDVAGVTDHRMLHLLHRLVQAESRLSAFEGAAGSVKSKLAAVPPKVMKAGTASSQSEGQMNKHARAKEAFLRSGRTLKDMRRYIDATS